MSNLTMNDTGLRGPLPSGTATGTFARLRAVAAATALLVAGASAHAGLFDDDEARRAILDLRTRIGALEDARRTRDARSTRRCNSSRAASSN
jgi:hypothetical protein